MFYSCFLDILKFGLKLSVTTGLHKRFKLWAFLNRNNAFKLTALVNVFCFVTPPDLVFGLEKLHVMDGELVGNVTERLCDTTSYEEFNGWLDQCQRGIPLVIEGHVG